MAAAAAGADDALHGNLAAWIATHGGEVHRHLALHTPSAGPNRGTEGTSVKGVDAPNKFSHRGIFALLGPINEGEVLIRLPRRLALDGSGLPVTYAPGRTDGTESKEGASTGDQLERNASPWLRCLASFVHARCRSQQHAKESVKSDDPNSKSISFDPYLSTLPDEYDSLLNWTSAEIRSFLAGTTLGAAALPDACDAEKPNANDKEDDRELRERFQRSVAPYLAYLESNDGYTFAVDACNGDGAAKDTFTPSNPKRQKMDKTAHGNVEHLYPLFREGCMCISTRAFHMQSPANTGAATDDGSYQGPYLLPYIDLLNHAPKGSSKHVTTLRRNPGGSFVMVAERDIAEGEEICHSYSSGAASDSGCANGDEPSSLNSAQLLQTFGFVDVSEAVPRLFEYYSNRDEQRHNGIVAKLGNISPAVLTKDEISRTCKQVASSTYPQELRANMEERGLLDEGWEWWEMPTLDESSPRWEPLASLSDEFVVSCGGPLPDEMITICCLHFLPEDAINGLVEEDQSQSLLLGREVLEDFYLGKLVLLAILETLTGKCNAYQVSSVLGQKEDAQSKQLVKMLRPYYQSGDDVQEEMPFSWGDHAGKDAYALARMISSRGARAESLQKFMNGMVVSLEERTCLSELARKVTDMIARLSLET